MGNPAQRGSHREFWRSVVQQCEQRNAQLSDEHADQKQRLQGAEATVQVLPCLQNESWPATCRCGPQQENPAADYDRKPVRDVPRPAVLSQTEKNRLNVRHDVNVKSCDREQCPLGVSTVLYRAAPDRRQSPTSRDSICSCYSEQTKDVAPKQSAGVRSPCTTCSSTESTDDGEDMCDCSEISPKKYLKDQPTTAGAVDRPVSTQPTAGGEIVQAQSSESCSCSNKSTEAAPRVSPSNFSIGEEDIVYVERVRQLLENEKRLKKEMEDLARIEKCMEERLKRRRPHSESSGSGDYEVQNLKRLNGKLEESNNILEVEIQQTTANIKHLKENVEEPMKREIEMEKKKIRELEDEFRQSQCALETKRLTQEKEIELVRNQLQHANQYLCDLNLVNKRLKEELCMLNCKCNELQTDIINQKLSEIHTISRLCAQKRRVPEPVGSKRSKGSSGDGGGGGRGSRSRRSGSRSSRGPSLASRSSGSRASDRKHRTPEVEEPRICPKEQPCLGKEPEAGDGENDLGTIARNLSKLLAQANECNTCQCAHTDLIDTVKYIKDLVEMLNDTHIAPISSTESLSYCECVDLERLSGMLERRSRPVDIPPSETPLSAPLEETESILTGPIICSSGETTISPEGDGEPVEVPTKEPRARIEPLPTEMAEGERRLPSVTTEPPTSARSTPTPSKKDVECKPLCEQLSTGRDEIGSQQLLGLLLEYLDVQLDERGQLVLDEEGRPFAKDGTLIDVRMADIGLSTGKPEKMEEVLLALLLQQVDVLLDERGQPVLDECGRLLTPEGIPIDVLVDEDGKPILDERGRLIAPSGRTLEEGLFNLLLENLEEMLDERRRKMSQGESIDVKSGKSISIAPSGRYLGDEIVSLLLQQVQLSLDKYGKPILDELGYPLAADGTPIQLKLDELGEPMRDQQGLLLGISGFPIAEELLSSVIRMAEDQTEDVTDDEQARRLEAVLDEKGLPLSIDGQPTEVLLDESGKPILDEAGHFLTPSGQPIASEDLLKATPPHTKLVLDEEGRPLRMGGKPIDVQMDEDGKPLLDGLPIKQRAEPEKIPDLLLDDEGKPVLDEHGRLQTVSGTAIISEGGPLPLEVQSAPIKVKLDELGEPILDEYGRLQTPSGRPIIPEGVPPPLQLQLDEQGKPIVDEEGRSIRADGTPIEVKLDEQGQPVLDEYGRLQTPSGRSIIPEGIPPLLQVQLDEQGKPIVDEKGRPVRVDGTPIEVKLDEQGQPVLDEYGRLQTPSGRSIIPEGIPPPLQVQLDEQGKPIVDEKGRPVRVDGTPIEVKLDEQGQPMLDEHGRLQTPSGRSITSVVVAPPLQVQLDEQGMPIVDEKGRPIRADGAPIEVKLDKQGQPVLDEHGQLQTPSGRSIIPKEVPPAFQVQLDERGEPIVDEQGRPIRADGTPIELKLDEQGQPILDEHGRLQTPSGRSITSVVVAPPLQVQLDEQGQPIVDEKGRPIRADGTPIEVKLDEQGQPVLDEHGQLQTPSGRSIIPKEVPPAFQVQLDERGKPIVDEEGRPIRTDGTPIEVKLDEQGQPVLDEHGQLQTPSGRSIIPKEVPPAFQVQLDERGKPIVDEQGRPIRTDGTPIEVKLDEQGQPVLDEHGQLQTPSGRSIIPKEVPPAFQVQLDERRKPIVDEQGRPIRTDGTPIEVKLDEQGQPVLDEHGQLQTPSGRSIIPKEVPPAFQVQLDERGKPIVDEQGRPIRTDGTPIEVKLDEQGQPVLDEHGQLQTPSGRSIIPKEIPPAFKVQLDERGKPIVDEQGRPIRTDGTPIEVKLDEQGQPVLDEHGQLQTPSGRSIIPKAVPPAFQVQLDEHGKPIVDEQGRPIRADGTPIEVKLDEQGQPILDEHGRLQTPSGRSITSVVVAPPPQVQLDEQGKPIVDEKGRPIRRDGTPIEVKLDEQGQPVLDEYGRLQTPSGRSITSLGVSPPPQVQLDEQGKPIVDEKGRPIRADGTPIEVKLDEQGQPVLDKHGQLQTSSGRSIVPEGVPPRLQVQVDEYGKPIVDEQGRSITTDGTPIDVKLDEQGQPILDKYGRLQTPSGRSIIPEGVPPPLQVQLDQQGKPIVDEKGRPIRADGIPVEVKLDEQGQPVLDEHGQLQTPSGRSIIPEGVPPPLQVQLDDHGKPIVDEQGRPIRADGTPIEVKLDEQGKPVLDEFGRLQTPSGRSITSVGLPPPLQVQLDEYAKPIVDEKGRPIRADGTPIEVKLDEQGQPVLDEHGQLQTPSGRSIIPEGVPPPLQVQLDEYGKPIVDEQGRPIRVDGTPIEVKLDGQGQPILDEHGQLQTPSGRSIIPKEVPPAFQVQLDERGKPIVDEQGRPIRADGTPIELKLDEQGQPLLDEHGQLQTPSGRSIIPAGVPPPPQVQLDEYGKPIVDEQGRPIRADGTPIEVKLDEQGQPVLDEYGRLQTPSGRSITSVGVPPLPRAQLDEQGKPVVDEKGRPISIDGTPIEVKLDEHGQPLLDEHGQLQTPSGRSIIPEGVPPPLQIQLDEHGKPIVDEQGRPIRADGIPIDVKLDEHGQPVLDEYGHLQTPSGRSVVPESVPPPLQVQLDEQGKPIVDETGRPIRADGTPVEVKLDERGQPVLDEHGRLQTPSGRSIVPEAVPPLPEIELDEQGKPILDEEPQKIQKIDEDMLAKLSEQVDIMIDVNGQPVFDERGRLLGSMGIPIDILCDDQGRPVLDEDGNFLGTDGYPLRREPKTPPSSAYDDVDLVPLPETEAIPDLFKEPYEGEVQMLGTSMDGTYVTKAAAGAGMLHVTTEGPAGVIDTRVKMSESGRFQVLTDMTEFEQEAEADLSLSETTADETTEEEKESSEEAEAEELTSGPDEEAYEPSTTDESLRHEIDEGAEGDVMRSAPRVEVLDEESIEGESEISEEGAAHEVTTDEGTELESSQEAPDAVAYEDRLAKPIPEEEEAEEVLPVCEIEEGDEVEMLAPKDQEEAMLMPPVCEPEEYPEEILPVCEMEEDAPGDNVEMLMPPVCELEESKEEVLAMRGDEGRPCVCKADKGCQCAGTDKLCQCEDELPEEEMKRDQAVLPSLGVGDRENIILSTADLDQEKPDIEPAAPCEPAALRICKPDICTTGDRGGDVRWICECRKGRSTLCDECSNYRGRRRSRVQLDLKISCEQPCKVIKSRTRYRESDSSGSTTGSSDDNMRFVCTRRTSRAKHKTSRVGNGTKPRSSSRGVRADVCENVGIQQNYYDFDDSESTPPVRAKTRNEYYLCTDATCQNIMACPRLTNTPSAPKASSRGIRSEVSENKNYYDFDDSEPTQAARAKTRNEYYLCTDATCRNIIACPQLTDPKASSRGISDEIFENNKYYDFGDSEPTQATRAKTRNEYYSCTDAICQNLTTCPRLTDTSGAPKASSRGISKEIFEDNNYYDFGGSEPTQAARAKTRKEYYSCTDATCQNLTACPQLTDPKAISRGISNEISENVGVQQRNYYGSEDSEPRQRRDPLKVSDEYLCTDATCRNITACPRLKTQGSHTSSAPKDSDRSITDRMKVYRVSSHSTGTDRKSSPTPYCLCPKRTTTPDPQKGDGNRAPSRKDTSSKSCSCRVKESDTRPTTTGAFQERTAESHVTQPAVDTTACPVKIQVCKETEYSVPGYRDKGELCQVPSCPVKQNTSKETMCTPELLKRLMVCAAVSPVNIKCPKATPTSPFADNRNKDIFVDVHTLETSAPKVASPKPSKTIGRSVCVGPCQNEVPQSKSLQVKVPQTEVQQTISGVSDVIREHDLTESGCGPLTCSLKSKEEPATTRYESASEVPCTCARVSDVAPRAASGVGGTGAKSVGISCQTSTWGKQMVSVAAGRPSEINGPCCNCSSSSGETTPAHTPVKIDVAPWGSPGRGSICTCSNHTASIRPSQVQSRPGTPLNEGHLKPPSIGAESVISECQPCRCLECCSCADNPSVGVGSVRVRESDAQVLECTCSEGSAGYRSTSMYSELLPCTCSKGSKTASSGVASQRTDPLPIGDTAAVRGGEVQPTYVEGTVPAHVGEGPGVVAPSDFSAPIQNVPYGRAFAPSSEYKCDKASLCCACTPEVSELSNSALMCYIHDTGRIAGGVSANGTERSVSPMERPVFPTERSICPTERTERSVCGEAQSAAGTERSVPCSPSCEKSKMSERSSAVRSMDLTTPQERHRGSESILEDPSCTSSTCEEMNRKFSPGTSSIECYKICGCIQESVSTMESFDNERFWSCKHSYEHVCPEECIRAVCDYEEVEKRYGGADELVSATTRRVSERVDAGVMTPPRSPTMSDHHPPTTGSRQPKAPHSPSSTSPKSSQVGQYDSRRTHQECSPTTCKRLRVTASQISCTLATCKRKLAPASPLETGAELPRISHGLPEEPPERTKSPSIASSAGKPTKRVRDTILYVPVPVDEQTPSPLPEGISSPLGSIRSDKVGKPTRRFRAPEIHVESVTSTISSAEELVQAEARADEIRSIPSARSQEESGSPAVSIESEELEMPAGVETRALKVPLPAATRRPKKTRAPDDERRSISTPSVRSQRESPAASVRSERPEAPAVEEPSKRSASKTSSPAAASVRSEKASVPGDEKRSTATPSARSQKESPPASIRSDRPEAPVVEEPSKRSASKTPSPAASVRSEKVGVPGDEKRSTATPSARSKRESPPASIRSERPEGPAVEEPSKGSASKTPSPAASVRSEKAGVTGDEKRSTATPSTRSQKESPPASTRSERPEAPAVEEPSKRSASKTPSPSASERSEKAGIPGDEKRSTATPSARSQRESPPASTRSERPEASAVEEPSKRSASKTPSPAASVRSEKVGVPGDEKRSTATPSARSQKESPPASTRSERPEALAVEETSKRSASKTPSPAASVRSEKVGVPGDEKRSTPTPSARSQKESPPPSTRSERPEAAAVEEPSKRSASKTPSPAASVRSEKVGAPGDEKRSIATPSARSQKESPPPSTRSERPEAAAVEEPSKRSASKTPSPAASVRSEKVGVLGDEKRSTATPSARSQKESPPASTRSERPEASAVEEPSKRSASKTPSPAASVRSEKVGVPGDEKRSTATPSARSQKESPPASTRSERPEASAVEEPSKRSASKTPSSAASVRPEKVGAPGDEKRSTATPSARSQKESPPASTRSERPEASAVEEPSKRSASKTPSPAASVRSEKVGVPGDEKRSTATPSARSQKESPPASTRSERPEAAAVEEPSKRSASKTPSPAASVRSEKVGVPADEKRSTATPSARSQKESPPASTRSERPEASAIEEPSKRGVSKTPSPAASVRSEKVGVPGDEKRSTATPSARSQRESPPASIRSERPEGPAVEEPSKRSASKTPSPTASVRSDKVGVPGDEKRSTATPSARSQRKSPPASIRSERTETPIDEEGSVAVPSAQDAAEVEDRRSPSVRSPRESGMPAISVRSEKDGAPGALPEEHVGSPIVSTRSEEESAIAAAPGVLSEKGEVPVDEGRSAATPSERSRPESVVPEDDVLGYVEPERTHIGDVAPAVGDAGSQPPGDLPHLEETLEGSSRPEVDDLEAETASTGRTDIEVGSAGPAGSIPSSSRPTSLPRSPRRPSQSSAASPRAEAASGEPEAMPDSSRRESISKSGPSVRKDVPTSEVSSRPDSVRKGESPLRSPLDSKARLLGFDEAKLEKPGSKLPVPQTRAHPLGCRCQKCICLCTEETTDFEIVPCSIKPTSAHPANCACIDCICDPAKFEKVQKIQIHIDTGDAIPRHPADCACVDCLCDPTKGFTKEVTSEIRGVGVGHKVRCDCAECICAPCADGEIEPVCPSFRALHHPDCECPECACDKCLHVPDCQCTDCICIRCAHFNAPKNKCNCIKCICAPCGDTELESVDELGMEGKWGDSDDAEVAKDSAKGEARWETEDVERSGTGEADDTEDTDKGQYVSGDETQYEDAEELDSKGQDQAGEKDQSEASGKDQYDDLEDVDRHEVDDTEPGRIDQIPPPETEVSPKGSRKVEGESEIRSETGSRKPSGGKASGRESETVSRERPEDEGSRKGSEKVPEEKADHATLPETDRLEEVSSKGSRKVEDESEIRPEKLPEKRADLTALLEIARLEEVSSKGSGKPSGRKASGRESETASRERPEDEESRKGSEKVPEKRADLAALPEILRLEEASSKGSRKPSGGKASGRESETASRERPEDEGSRKGSERISRDLAPDDRHEEAFDQESADEADRESRKRLEGMDGGPGRPVHPSGHPPGKRHPDCDSAEECLCEECLDIPVCDCEDLICENCADETVAQRKLQGDTKHPIECDCVACRCSPCRDKAAEERKPKKCNCTQCRCNPCRDKEADERNQQKLRECDAGAEKDDTCDCWFCMCKKCKDPRIRAVTNAPFPAVFSSGWDHVKVPDTTPLMKAIQASQEHPSNCKCYSCSCDPCKKDPFRSYLNEVHGLDCTCSLCKCSPCELKERAMKRKEREEKRKHKKECDCIRCRCDPCDDPVFRTKRTLEKLKRADCNCPICRCDPCKDPEHGPGCKCPKCVCEPCPKMPADVAKKSAPIDKHPDGCRCLSCVCAPCPKKLSKPAHGPDCDCAQCSCKPCPSQSRGATCPCAKCACDPCTKKMPPTCQCAECTCEPCFDENVKKKVEGPRHAPRCQCPECLCEPCFDENIKSSKQPKEGPVSIPPPVQHGPNCQCPQCLCQPCFDDKIKTTHPVSAPTASAPVPLPTQHEPNCQCPQCLSRPSSGDDDNSDKLSENIPAPTCECAVCECKPCFDERVKPAEGAHGEGCVCPICAPIPSLPEPTGKEDAEVNVPERTAGDLKPSMHRPDCRCKKCICEACDKPEHEMKIPKDKHGKHCKCEVCACKKKDRNKSSEEPHKKKKRKSDHVAGCQCKHCAKAGEPQGTVQSSKCPWCECSPVCICETCPLKTKKMAPAVKIVDKELPQKTVRATQHETADRKKELEVLEQLMQQIRASCDSAQVEAARNYLVDKGVQPCSVTMQELQSSLKQLEEKCENKDRIIEAMVDELRVRSDTAKPQLALAPPCAGISTSSKPLLQVKEVKRISSDSVLVKWTQPSGDQIVGYEISVDNTTRSRVHSAQRTSAVVFGVQASKKALILVYAMTQQGRCDPPAAYQVN